MVSCRGCNGEVLETGTHRIWEEGRGRTELYGDYKDLGVTWESTLVANTKRDKRA